MLNSTQDQINLQLKLDLSMEIMVSEENLIQDTIISGVLNKYLQVRIPIIFRGP